MPLTSQSIYQPSISEILSVPAEFNVIPIIKEISGDMETPISMFSSFYDGDFAFFFESAEGVGKWGRYSYICLNPFLTIESYESSITVNRYADSKIISSEKLEITDISGGVFSFIKKILSEFKFYDKNIPEGFIGGLFGYLGYEISGFIEKLPSPKKDKTNVSDLFFMLPREIIVYDALKQKIIIVSLIFKDNLNNKSIKEEVGLSINRIDNIISIIENRKIKISKSFSNDNNDVAVEDEIGFTEYREKVLKAKNYILQGDIFQVQVSRRKKILNPPHPFLFYRALRLVNPSPYMFYLKINSSVIAGSSPENLVKLSDGHVEIRPIAGTIKRGENEELDNILSEKMLNDPKERAEHIMLVDLGRNDIGRVSRIGSVLVDRLMYIEKYSHVQHIVTSVVSEIKENLDGFDLIKAVFPAGTLTGAPKVRAMEIIHELEDSKRGIYGGGIGYFGFLDHEKCVKMEFCITIRTALFKDDFAYIQAAGGVVYDSTPENEFNETENKLKGLIAAFNLSKKIFN